jgi:hypothetical protein
MWPNQQPDPLIKKHVPANAAPAHRGLVTIVFEDLPLDEFGNRVPPITSEVAWAGAADAVANTATINSSYEPDHFSVDPTHNRGFVRTGIRLLPWVLYGKALARPGVEDARSREPVVGELRHPHPRRPILLAASPRRAPPEVRDLVAECPHGPTIGRHRMVGEEAGHDLPQPLPLLGDRLVPPPSQFLP